MIILLTIVHIFVCLFLIIVVLLQHGKAADLAGAFGGMGSQTFFGPRGAATAMSKATTIAAALFMVTSLSLAILATRGTSAATGSTVLEKVQEPAKPAQSEKGGTTVPLTLPGQEGVQPQGQAPAPPAKPPAPAPAK